MLKVKSSTIKLRWNPRVKDDHRNYIIGSWEIHIELQYSDGEYKNIYIDIRNATDSIDIYFKEGWWNIEMLEIIIPIIRKNTKTILVEMRAMSEALLWVRDGTWLEI